jgi:hypothetical protein
MSNWIDRPIFRLAACALLAATAGRALADAAAPPAAPALSEVLKASGLTLGGYLDGTYSYASTAPSGAASADANTFALNQAAFTLGYAGPGGFGALVNVVAGTEACNGCYAPGYGTGGAGAGTSSFNLLQGYLSYSSGKLTTSAGKFLTLAGAEVAAPTGNSNVTRSLLFWYSEPVTHVGARLAFAASDTATLTLGANNGWNIDGSTARGGKTAEVGLTLTPSKVFTFAAAGYLGDYALADTVGKRSLLDAVATWNVSSALTLIASADFDSQDHAFGPGSGSASWYGVALYCNYAISEAWRTSVRAEYLDDRDGFNFGAKTRANEATLTLGYMPDTHFEFRTEGRYDTYRPDGAGSDKVTQLWLQGLYKF